MKSRLICEEYLMGTEASSDAERNFGWVFPAQYVFKPLAQLF
jgi:hypothetical protein